MFNKNMRKNELSDRTKKGEKWNKMIPIVILSGGITILFLSLYRKSLKLDKNFIIYLNNHVLLLFIGLSIIIIGGVGLYYILWRKENLNPAYIDWDDEGVYIINKKGKKEFYEWEKIKNLRKVQGEYTDYGFNIEGQMSPRLVNEEIGRELKEYYRKRKWNNSKN